MIIHDGEVVQRSPGQDKPYLTAAVADQFTSRRNFAGLWLLKWCSEGARCVPDYSCSQFQPRRKHQPLASLIHRLPGSEGLVAHWLSGRWIVQTIR